MNSYLPAATTPATKIVLPLLLMLFLTACDHKNPTPSATPASTSASTPASAPTSIKNSVVAYFSGAETQLETYAQCIELRRAYEDMLSLPASELKTRRYADYSGTKNERGLFQLLRGHIVPSPLRDPEADQFLADLKTAAGQSVLRAAMNDLNCSARHDAPTTR